MSSEESVAQSGHQKTNGGNQATPQRLHAVGIATVAVGLLAALGGPPNRSDASALGTLPSHWEMGSNASLFSGPAQSTRPLVVVAGLSRTGTSSLQMALSALNLTTYHTYETMTHHLDFWYFYLSGQIAKPNVAALVEPRDVEAMADCWFAYLTPEILRAYPEAKVILGTRDHASWLKSYDSYIENSDLYHWSRQLHRLVLSRVSRGLCLGKLFRAVGVLPDEESGLDLDKLPILMDVWKRVDSVVYGSNTPNPTWRAAFERHNSYIRSLVPEDRFLEFDIGRGHGWPELLDFLGIDGDLATQFKNKPFPRVNCVASESCFSHLSARFTARHECLTGLCIAAILLALWGVWALSAPGPQIHPATQYFQGEIKR